MFNQKENILSPKMEIKCEFCGGENGGIEGYQNYYNFFYIEASGISSIKKMWYCNQCGGALRCPQHKVFNVVFIDNTHVCNLCVIKETENEIREMRDVWRADLNRLVQIANKDREEFYSVVRPAVDDIGQKKSNKLLLFITAVVARSQATKNHIGISLMRPSKLNR